MREILNDKSILLPLFAHKVSAGFPSPADDYLEAHIDLNQLLIKKPAATFMLRAIGDSMIGVGIFPGDLLIVDRSLTAQHHQIVIALLNGELTVKRLYHKQGIVKLLAENNNYPPIMINGELEIWGVVRHVIHSFKVQ